MDGEGKTFPLGTPELRQRQKRAFVEKSEMYSIPTLSNSAVGLLKARGHSSMKELLPPGRGSAGVAQQCPVGK